MLARALRSKVIESLEHFSVVGLVGSRQSGKTTLAKWISADMPADVVYLDLERPSDLDKLGEAELYLEHVSNRLVIIDEAQRKPDLFPLIRALVDANPARKGRFLLLGSASPDLTRQASESLAGRIVYHELTPFSLEEAGATSAKLLWSRGGYPPSFLAADDYLSLQWREAFIQTYLERDLPQLGVRVPSTRLRRFWEMVAHSHGHLWNASAIGASLGVSAPAVRRYLDILQDTYVVRQLRPYHANIKKRLVKSPKVYLRDTGLLHALLRIPDWDVLLGTPYAGSSWEGWVVEQVASVLSGSWQLYFYRTSAGAEIDLVAVPPGGDPVAIEAKLSASPRVTKGYRIAFRDLGCKRGFVVYPGHDRYPLGDGVEALPAADLPRLGESLG